VGDFARAKQGRSFGYFKLKINIFFLSNLKVLFSIFLRTTKAQRHRGKKRDKFNKKICIRKENGEIKYFSILFFSSFFPLL
jgi:transposase